MVLLHGFIKKSQGTPAPDLKAQKLTKTAMAARMHTSRAALNRLLDEEDTSLTLTTLASALKAPGKRMEFVIAA